MSDKGYASIVNRGKPHFDIVLQLNDNDVCVNMVSLFKFVHTFSDISRAFKGISEEQLMQVCTHVGIDTTFPGSNWERFLSIVEQEKSDKEKLDELLKSIGEYSRNLEMELNGLSIESYYKFLLPKLIGRENFEIIAMRNRYGTEFEYCLVQKTSDCKSEQKYNCYLFNKEKMEFEPISILELGKLMRKRKFSFGTTGKFERRFHDILERCG